MLLSRRRRRHGAYAVPAPSAERGARKAPALFFAVIVVFGAWLMLRSFSSGGEMRRVATVLTVDGRGRVEVAMDGDAGAQRAESGLKLYESDSVRTDNASYASLRFFDGTDVILDRESSVRLQSVLQGTESSVILIALERGRVFVKSGTGSAVGRTVISALASHAIPPSTQAMIGTGLYGGSDTGEVLAVIESTGQGALSTVKIGRSSAELITGEGQQLMLSASSLTALAETGGDPYSLRSALQSSIVDSEFGLYAREERSAETESESASSSSNGSEVVSIGGIDLAVDEPQDGALLTEEAVVVKGRVGSNVLKVRVMGYIADLENGVFQKEIALPDEEEFSIEVQAEDKDGLIVGTKSIALRRDIKPPEPPTITSPAEITIDSMANPSEPVIVSDEEFEITGTASDDAVGIIVNGYRLQKYQPGKPWAYLVNGALGNINVGENTFEVVAVDRSGNTSSPVKIVILWRAEAVPTVPDSAEVSNDSSTYLAKGSLRVIAPTSGTTYETSEEEVLIEGETHPDTDSISINGYRLSLYLPGKVTWNYIVKEEFGNYRIGVNRYTIVSRNSEGKIIDVLRYAIERK